MDNEPTWAKPCNLKRMRVVHMYDVFIQQDATDEEVYAAVAQCQMGDSYGSFIELTDEDTGDETQVERPYLVWDEDSVIEERGRMIASIGDIVDGLYLV